MSQKQVFEGVSQLFEYQKGENQTIMAYGHTASGKTHTMFGNNAWLALVGKARNGKNYFSIITKLLADPLGVEFGLAQHTLDHLYRDEQVTNISISFFQIYVEQVIDLLASPGVGLLGTNERSNEPEEAKIYQTAVEGVIVSGISEYSPASLPEAIDYLRRGCLQRKVRDNTINRFSSRSHTILRLTITLSGVEKPVRINIVDLAGSERYLEQGVMSKTHQQEQKSINQSLSTLSKVILQLNNGNYSHIHFRESKLTRILKDSLEGKSKVILLANLAPVKVYQEESLRTLQFAKNCAKLNTKLIELEPESVQVSADKRADFYRKELDYYKSLLQLKRSANAVNPTQTIPTTIQGVAPDSQGLEERLHKLEAEKLEFKKTQQMYMSELLSLQRENELMKLRMHEFRLDSPKSSLFVQTSRDDSTSIDRKSVQDRMMDLRPRVKASPIGIQLFSTEAPLLDDLNEGIVPKDELNIVSGKQRHSPSKAPFKRSFEQGRLTSPYEQQTRGESLPEVDASFYARYLKMKANLELLQMTREETDNAGRLASPQPRDSSSLKETKSVRGHKLSNMSGPLRNSISSMQFKQQGSPSRGLMSIWAGEDLLPAIKRRRLGKVPESFLVKNSQETGFFSPVPLVSVPSKVKQLYPRNLASRFDWSQSFATAPAPQLEEQATPSLSLATALRLKRVPVSQACQPSMGDHTQVQIDSQTHTRTVAANPHPQQHHELLSQDQHRLGRTTDPLARTLAKYEEIFKQKPRPLSRHAAG